jgi:phage-related minor tail protein
MVPLSDEWKRTTDLIKGYRSEIENTADKMFDLNIQSQLWTQTLVEGLADAIAYGRNLSDVLNNILRQLASSMLQKLIFGWLPFEKGGVIDKGKVQPFASGGIIDKPLIFPMARGAGIAGEAGPEAILPLKRTSSGDLGVKAEGGGVTSITMNINAVDANSFVQMLKNNKTAITSLIVENISNNGQVRRILQEVT